MSAFNHAKTLAEEKAAKKKEEARIAESDRRYEESRKGMLEAHVQKTLADFNGVNGLKHKGIELLKDKTVIATVTVRWQALDGYVISWQVKGHWSDLDWNRTPEDFDKFFGEAMVRYL